MQRLPVQQQGESLLYHHHLQHAANTISSQHNPQSATLQCDVKKLADGYCRLP